MKFLNHYYRPLLIVILAFAFFTRVARLSQPNTYIFDEVYHAITAKLIARNDHRAYEWWNPPVEPNTSVDWLHPPLAKYTQAASMLVFGENSFGWRFSSALFGVGVIWATAYLSLILFKNKPLSLLAALLASLDGLLLVQSRIAMNDIHVTFLILLTAIMYRLFRDSQSQLQLNKWLWLTGLSAGLAMGTKWSGLFILIFVWMYELWSLVTSHAQFKKKMKFFLQRLVVLGVLPLIIYILSYSHMFLQGKTLVCLSDRVQQGKCYYEELPVAGHTFRFYASHFYELHRQIWWYQTHLTATHSYQSRPWQWFFDLRPVWMYVKYEDADHIGNIYSQGNPLLFWTGDVALIASLGGLAGISLLAFKRRSLSKTQLKKIKPAWTQYEPVLFVLLAYSIVWIPWQLSPRIMFFYHYTPAVPFLCINLAFWLHQLFSPATKQDRLLSQSLAWTTLLIIALTFVLFYPNWTGIVVSKSFMNRVYFAVESWH